MWGGSGLCVCVGRYVAVRTLGKLAGSSGEAEDGLFRAGVRGGSTAAGPMSAGRGKRRPSPSS